MNTAVEPYSPSWLRLLLAFALATIVPVMLAAVFFAHNYAATTAAKTSGSDGLSHVLIYAQALIERAPRFALLGLIVGGVVPALIVSGAFYAIFRRKMSFRFITSALVGGIAANTQGIFVAIWDVLTFFGGCDGNFSFAQGGRQLVEDGCRTTHGWIAFLVESAFTFGLGALGGLVFWWILRDRRSKQ